MEFLGKKLTSTDLFILDTLFTNQHSFSPTLILKAIEDGNIDLAKELIKNNVRLDEYNNDGESCLFVSIRLNEFELVELLIETQDFEINHTCTDLRHTPLTYAAKFNCNEIFEYLINKGCNIDHKCYNGNTALIYACSNKNTDMVRELLKKNANVKIKNRSGYTPLMYACKTGNLDIVNLLLSVDKTNINEKNEDGYTALMFASANGHKNVVQKLLVDGGANVRIQIGYFFGKETAKTLAQRHNYQDIVSLLMHYESNDDQTNSDINTRWEEIRKSFSSKYMRFMDDQDCESFEDDIEENIVTPKNKND